MVVFERVKLTTKYKRIEVFSTQQCVFLLSAYFVFFYHKKTSFAKHSPTFSYVKAGLLFTSCLKWKIYHWYPLRVYKGSRTLQAASLTFWFSGAGTLSVGFVALSKRVTAVHYLKQIQVLHFTFVLRLSRQKKAHKKEEPAGSTDPRPLFPLNFSASSHNSRAEVRREREKGFSRPQPGRHQPLFIFALDLLPS